MVYQRTCDGVSGQVGMFRAERQLVSHADRVLDVPTVKHIEPQDLSVLQATVGERNNEQKEDGGGSEVFEEIGASADQIRRTA